MSKQPSDLDEIWKWIEKRKGRRLGTTGSARALAALEGLVTGLGNTHWLYGEDLRVIESLLTQTLRILRGEREETKP